MHNWFISTLNETPPLFKRGANISYILLPNFQEESTLTFTVYDLWLFLWGSLFSEDKNLKITLCIKADISSKSHKA